MIDRFQAGSGGVGGPAIRAIATATVKIISSGMTELKTHFSIPALRLQAPYFDCSLPEYDINPGPAVCATRIAALTGKWYANEPIRLIMLLEWKTSTVILPFTTVCLVPTRWLLVLWPL